MTGRKQKMPLTPDAVQIGDQLHSAAIHLLRRLKVRDPVSGIGPSQLSALSVLVFGGPRSLGELADAEQVRPPTMSRMVTGLEKAGLVKRFATVDKRKVRLEATAKGTKILWEGRRRRVKTLARALQALNAEELQKAGRLAEFMQQLVRKL